MRKAMMIAGLAILSVGVLAPAGALGKTGGTDRPIKDTESGTTVLDLGSLTFATDATGNTSHLGRTTTHLDAALTLTGPDTFTLAGSGTIVAADGSELSVTFTGSGTLEASGDTGGPRGPCDHRRNWAVRERERKSCGLIYPGVGVHGRDDGDLRHRLLAKRHDQLLGDLSPYAWKGSRNESPSSCFGAGNGRVGLMGASAARPRFVSNERLQPWPVALQLRGPARSEPPGPRPIRTSRKPGPVRWPDRRGRS